MREQTRKIAVCGMMAALGVAVMLLGSMLGLGLYLSPMLAGLCLRIVGREWGGKYHLLVWAAVSLLCLMLISDAEQNLMFIGWFGWYPALRPRLQTLRPALRLPVKLLLFNGAVIALEALVTLVLVPEQMGLALAAALLVLGNVTFVLYDTAIPYLEAIAAGYLRRIFPGGR